MTKKQYARLVELVKATPPDVILKAAARCDGHSILNPEAFTDVGLPHDVVEHLTTRYKSDGTPKGTIFVGGQPVKELTGVYGLDVLTFIAGALGVEYEDKIGRGFCAQSTQQALHKHFASQPDTKPAA